MAANNEIEYCNRWQTLVQSAERKVFFHTDAARHRQDPLNVEAMKIDLMSMTAHKVYGPKGMGTLRKRRHPRVQLSPSYMGGGMSEECSGTYIHLRLLGLRKL